MSHWFQEAKVNARQTFRCVLALVILFVAATAPASPATPPKVTDLGALLLEPGISSFPVSVNDRGQVVGMAYDPNDWNKYAAVVWQPDPSGPQPILLGDLLGPIHYELSIPDNGWGPQRAINGEGQIVGYASKAGRSIGAVIWHQQAPGVFVPSYLTGSSAARAINSLGQIIGGGNFWDGPNAGPVRLDVEGFVGPDAYDLNDGGQIVGTAFDISVGRYRPLLWNPDDQGGFEAMVLPSLPPDGLTFAEAINNQGTVVGRCSGAGFSHAVVWEKKSDHYEVKTLAPPDGYVNASAHGINDAGQVTGNADDGTHSVGVWWKPDGSGVLSPTVLPADGFAGVLAATLNNRGQVVGVGWKYDPVYEQHALLWESDTTPPTISDASANPAVLWPPNHRMIDVAVSYGATDDSGSVTCRLGPVTCNEPFTPADWQVVDGFHVQLRSERYGGGNGRIYSIPITCTDASGNAVSQPLVVTAPHDQRK